MFNSADPLCVSALHNCLYQCCIVVVLQTISTGKGMPVMMGKGKGH
jgi:hypothetical protein